MEIIKINLSNINMPKNLVSCIGAFDGLHKGHQKLLETVITIGNINNYKTAMITFDPHPNFILKDDFEDLYITPLNKKIDILQKNYKIDYLIIIQFDEKLVKLTYEEFYNLFLKDLSTIVVGYDFRFGFKGIGNSQLLKELHNVNDNEVIIINKVIDDENNSKIGTKQIIEHLKKGNIVKVNNLLGYNYTVEGKVIEGSHIGTKIGYPTANIEIGEKYCYVKKGVYAVNVIINNISYLGIGNYGINPTFNKINKPRLEVHIFNFNNNIYGKIIKIEFIEFIREEKIFISVDDFLKQLKHDCNYCLNKYSKNLKLMEGVIV